MTAIAAPDDQDTSFSYDAAGRLVEQATPETERTYSYGPSGRRTAAGTSAEGSEGQLDYLWDPSFSLGQIAEISGSQERSFAYGRGRIAQAGPGGSTYLHTDNLGSVVATTNERGSRISRTTYNPYGSPAEAKGGSESSSFAYTGQLREEGSGRYHLRARDYDPEMAAFQTPDPISPGLGEPARSPYAYVGGRPTTMVDPSGMVSIGDVTPDFVEDAAKTVDDNVIDPVGNGITAAPGVVDDGWDATAGVRHTVGGIAEDGYNFVAPAADEIALGAGLIGLAVCTGATAGGCGALAATAIGGGIVSSLHSSGVVGPGEANYGEFAKGLAIEGATFGAGKGFEAVRRFHQAVRLPGGRQLPALTDTRIGQRLAPNIPDVGGPGYAPYIAGVAQPEAASQLGTYLLGADPAEASTLGQHPSK